MTQVVDDVTQVVHQGAHVTLQTTDAGPVDARPVDAGAADADSMGTSAGPVDTGQATASAVAAEAPWTVEQFNRALTARGLQPPQRVRHRTTPSSSQDIAG